MNEMKDIRKAPRAPGKSFHDIVQEYIAQTGEKVDDYLLIDKSEWLGDEEIPVDRYISREAHELEKEKIWKKVWQMACREEEIPDVGDAIVYDITNISILVVRTTKTEIKAYYNFCRHQGRTLRDAGVVSHNTELRCPFHGWCWKLDGKMKQIPSKWDFPQVDPAKFHLRDVNVGRWGGFVFINMDPNCESLESYLGTLPMHWEKFPLEDRYIAAHVSKIIRANWKVAQEAFMEAYHASVTHPQYAIYFGGVIPDNGQFEAIGNYARGLGQGAMVTKLSWEPSPEERLDALAGVGHPDFNRLMFAKYLSHKKTDLLDYELTARREALRKIIGNKVDELNPFELYGGGFFTVFPNFHPWWAYDEITYRFRPYKDDHEMSVMEIYLLRPFKGERPKPAPVRNLGPDESFLEASEELGVITRTFEQDEFNMAEVQKGLQSMKVAGDNVVLGTYQATKLRHFHKLWGQWTSRK